MFPRDAGQRCAEPGAGNTLAARGHPCLQSRHECLIGALEICSQHPGIEQILLPRGLKPLLIPAHVERISAHRDGVNKIRPVDITKERGALDSLLAQNAGRRRMPDAAVGPSVGDKLFRPVAVVGGIIRVGRPPWYDITERCILIEPILFGSQYLLFIHVNADVAPLVALRAPDEKPQLDETGGEVDGFAY